jgi:transcription initiation factor IIE alpha subunit
VYKVLESGGQLTQKDLIRETSLPSRTVRYAINRLKDEQFLIERHYFTDARQSLYGLNLQKVEAVEV